jgi:hypothetical protein
MVVLAPDVIAVLLGCLAALVALAVAGTHLYDITHHKDR